ncbi:hypothetical protein B0H14DRAFT_3455433 [Mycena olivaceomarginata]|nr:hypothetical protein B0H14DRAFT_3455433 [Mycena olivaceomarginata]
MSTVTPTPHRRTPSRTPNAGGAFFFITRPIPTTDFTNFSSHAVFYDNKRYPTSEHLFQSFKMDLALWHKFTQHESLKRELLATDDAELIEGRRILKYFSEIDG